MKSAYLHTTTVAAVAFALVAGMAVAQQGGRPLSAKLTGAAEVPGPGDTDGSGSASLTVNPGQGQVCYQLSVSGIDTASAAHIHRGGPAEAGGVAVPLKAPTGGSVEDCASIERDLAMELIQSPEKFYVNVHNAAFPKGAVRGQLSK